MKAFRKINLKDPTLTQLQDNISQAITPVLANPLLDSVLIENVQVSAYQDTAISHGLGRPYSHFFLLDPRDDTRVCLSSSPNPQKNSQILLNSTRDALISLIVF